MNELSERSLTAWRFIAEFIAERGIAPTMREIGRCLDISTGWSVEKEVAALERHRVISRQHGMSGGRAIALLRQPPPRRYAVVETTPDGSTHLNETPLDLEAARTLFNERCTCLPEGVILYTTQGEYELTMRRHDLTFVGALEIIEVE